jgi:hypothetical protein
MKHLYQLFHVLQNWAQIISWFFYWNLSINEALLDFCFNHLTPTRFLKGSIYRNYFQSLIFFHSIVIKRFFFDSQASKNFGVNRLLNVLFEILYLEFLKLDFKQQRTSLLQIIFRVFFQNWLINFLWYQLIVHLDWLFRFGYFFQKWVVNFEYWQNC